MTKENTQNDWNSFGRGNAGRRWRRQSAEMGSAATRALVEACRVCSGMRVLDVACGNGEPAISIAAALAGTGSVIGIDSAPEPLETARQRAAERGLANITFQQADAHALPFTDASFDLLTARCALMFFAAPKKAIAEFARVLAPGGRAAFLCWGPFEQQPYFQATAGAILRAFPDLELPASTRKMFCYAHPGPLAESLRAAGFCEAHEELITLPWPWAGRAEEMWAFMQETTIPFRPLFEAVPEEQRARRDRAVLEALESYRDGDRLALTATFNLTTALR